MSQDQNMTAIVEQETRKRKRLSKNKKKNWKKTDITDVEEHLDEKRFQESTGGLITERTDEQLFFVDTATEPETVEPVSKRKRAARTLKCHALLEPDPAIKSIRKSGNVRKEGLHRRCSAVQQRIAQGKLTVKEKQAQEQCKLAAETSSVRVKREKNLPVTKDDLWADNEHDKDADEHYMYVTKRKRRATLAHHHIKPSSLPAVEVPHPGASYNPTYNDHQDLLHKAVGVEEKKLSAELKLVRAVDNKIQKITALEVQNQWMKEMSAGITDKDAADDSDNEAKLDDNDDQLLKAPVRREDKKTKQQRRKLREQRAKESLAKQAKVQRIRKSDIYRLKSIKAEVEQRLDDVAKQQTRKAALRAERNLRPKKLGKLKFEDPNEEVKMSEELKGSLRLLQPEGCLVQDRFKSFQKRNLVEVRERAKFKRRYKPKAYTKKSHKDVV